MARIPGDDEAETFLGTSPSSKSAGSTMIKGITEKPPSETDLEEGRLLEDMTSFGSAGEADEPEIASKWKFCCSIVGFFVRALFAFLVFVLAVFLFVLLMQAAWRTYRDAGTRASRNRATALARKDVFAQTFPFCATRPRNRFGFIRNVCWSPKAENDEIDRFAILLSKSMLDEPGRGSGGTKRIFLVDALFDSGSAKEGTQLSMKHMPAIESDFNIFKFDLSPDSFFVDLQKQSTSFRARDNFTAQSIDKSVGWSGRMTSLEVLKTDEDEVWLDAVDLVKSLFYIISLPAASSNVMSRDTIRITHAEVFPLNVNIGIQLSSRPLLDRSSPPMTWSITFSLTLLAEKPAIAREMHDSVGYFTSAFRLLGSSTSTALRPNFLEETTVRIINRRRRFVYYIDPSVPPRWRSAVKRGVESWNFAFESFKSAIRLKVIAPGDPEWPADYSAPDIRYSSISWSISLDKVFAIGPSSVDPRSGEILNSDIVLSHGWIRNWFDDLDLLYDDDLFPVLSPPVSQHSSLRGQYLCHKSSSIAAAVRRGLLPSNLTDDQFVEMVEAGLADVVSHEVGHTLGLRHNFMGSLQVPLEKLGDKDYLDRYGLTASVMDYVPLNPSMPDTRYAFPLRIGSYDVKAIQYGYDEALAAPDELVLSDGTVIQLSSNTRLNDIALSAGAFSTDEDDASLETGWNPESSAFDLSSDPLGYAKKVLEDARILRAAIQKDQPPSRQDLAHRVLTGEVVFATRLAIKHLGGRTIRNRGRKMSGAIVQETSSEKQNEALSLVLRVLTASSAKYFPTSSWVKMGGMCKPGAPQQSCYGVQVVNERNHTDSARLKILGTLLAPQRLERLDDSINKKSMSLPQILEAVVNTLFADLANDDLWVLQSFFIKWMSDLVAGDKGSLSRQVVATSQSALLRINEMLRKVEGKSEYALNKPLGAHVQLCLKILALDRPSR